MVLHFYDWIGYNGVAFSALSNRVTGKNGGINVCFWETTHLPLLQPNINPYFSLWAKCCLRGGVGGQFPRSIH